MGLGTPSLTKEYFLYFQAQTAVQPQPGTGTAQPFQAGVGQPFQPGVGQPFQGGFGGFPFPGQFGQPTQVTLIFTIRVCLSVYLFSL